MNRRVATALVYFGLADDVETATTGEALRAGALSVVVVLAVVGIAIATSVSFGTVIQIGAVAIVVGRLGAWLVRRQSRNDAR